MAAEELNSNHEKSDEFLIERFKNNDADAFSELVNRYKKRAYYLAYNMLSNETDAEDVSQEAFLRVYKNIGSFRGTSSFRTWFYTIIVNLCRSHLRHRYLVSRFSFHFKEKDEMSDDPEKTIETSVGDTHWQCNPVKTTVNQELTKSINTAVDSLPPRQKEIFVLKHYQGLKISEIAAILKCAEGTVKANLFKAINNLKEKLRDYKEEVS
ncbi:MAG: sigma-70 family RNA polymerase sigma factor [bacterium]